MAITDFIKAMELEPDYALAYRNLGRVYALKENHEDKYPLPPGDSSAIRINCFAIAVLGCIYML